MAAKQKATPLQYAALLFAGVASFFLAAHFGHPGSDKDADLDLLSQPNRKAAASTTPILDAETPRQGKVSAADQERVRLDPLVLRDAFSPLDSSVTVESLLPPAPKPMGLAQAGTKVRKVAPKAPEPPPPAPPPVAVVPPPSPSAPPLPFHFIGALQGEKIGNGEITAFVASNSSSTVHLLKAGDVIDNTYKVVSVGNGKIEFIYLPLQTRQSLTMEK